MPLDVHAPVGGELSPLEDAPDPIFSMGALGWGVAIDPPREPMSVLAPVDGTIERIEPHVFSIAYEGGAVMVQVGVAADSLGGEGYTLHKRAGDAVRIGDAIVSWDPAEVEARGVVPMVIVVAIESGEHSLSRLRRSGETGAGDVVFVIP